MLRNVEEIQAQTREAIEDYLMMKIEDASKSRNIAVKVSREDLPQWLKEKLKLYGYIVTRIDNEVEEVRWGFQGA